MNCSFNQLNVENLTEKITIMQYAIKARKIFLLSEKRTLIFKWLKEDVAMQD